jgi:hypothetical protein
MPCCLQEMLTMETKHPDAAFTSVQNQDQTT